MVVYVYNTIQEVELEDHGPEPAGAKAQDPVEGQTTAKWAEAVPQVARRLPMKHKALNSNLVLPKQTNTHEELLLGIAQFGKYTSTYHPFSPILLTSLPWISYAWL
jgi:hypothetical protein